MNVQGDSGDSTQEQKAKQRAAPTDHVILISRAVVDEGLTVFRVRLRPRGFSAGLLSAGIEDGPAVGGPASDI